jgi:hypothetical protein
VWQSKLAHYPAKRPEGPQSAREHDNLLMLAGAAEGVEHALDAIVITIDKRVIEDDGHDLLRAPPIDQYLLTCFRDRSV